MKKRMVTAFLLLIFFASPAFSQEEEADKKLNDFMLIPILETALSGVLRWRPDWPADIPPDAFYLLNENVLPINIELSDGQRSFTVRRDSEGRLAEFPFFLANGYMQVETSYTQAGALKEMSVIFFDTDNSEDSEDGEDEEANVETEDEPLSQNEPRIWNITFPSGFLPYGESSAGGSLPPLEVVQGEDFFYVFIFESPVFLSETWYDSEGAMLLFCKALVDHEAGKWRVRSLQIHDSEGLSFQDYYFDSGGNISEVRLEGKVFSAVYRGNRPVSWRLDGTRYELQWDTQGILTAIRARGGSENPVLEYRYEYQRDTVGNWIKRQETAYSTRFSVLAPYLPGSRGTWERRIIY